jgi:hypothetical protein
MIICLMPFGVGRLRSYAYRVSIAQEVLHAIAEGAHTDHDLKVRVTGLDVCSLLLSVEILKGEEMITVGWSEGDFDRSYALTEKGRRMLRHVPCCRKSLADLR